MTLAGYESLLNKAIKNKDNETLRMIIVLLFESEQSKQELRNKGYGCTGLSLLETVKTEVPYVKEIFKETEEYMKVELTPLEISLLFNYHQEQADFYLGCKKTSLRHSIKVPVPQLINCNTKQDWIDSAKEYNHKSKYHKRRALFYKKFTEA